MKKLLLLTLIFVVAVSANAGLTNLPESSTGQGYSFYQNEDNGATAIVEYAVYDKLSTDDITSLSTNYSGLSDIGEGRYIYAYEIFTPEDSAQGQFPPIQSFSLLGIDPSAFTGIGDFDGGIEGSVASNRNVSGVDSLDWMFELTTLSNGATSYFLVYSSDGAPVMVDYEMETGKILGGGGSTGDGTPVVPEPTSVALLGLGMFVLRKVRRS